MTHISETMLSDIGLICLRPAELTDRPTEHVYLPLPLPFPATFRRAAALANISLSESSSPSLSDSDGGGTRGEDITGAIDTDGVIICT